jgi:hypothetical protein
VAETNDEKTGLAAWINKFYKPTGPVSNLYWFIDSILTLFNLPFTYKLHNYFTFYKASYMMGYRFFGGNATIETRYISICNCKLVGNSDFWIDVILIKQFYYTNLPNTSTIYYMQVQNLIFKTSRTKKVCKNKAYLLAYQLMFQIKTK